MGGENQADIDFLRDEALRLGLAERIVFTGPLPRDQAFAYVRAADVCLSPIHPNPILDVASPTKLVEYMAVAKPVVANEHPEQVQVIAASGGGVIVPWAAERFASAVIELLQDPGARRRDGAQGQGVCRAPSELRSHRRACRRRLSVATKTVTSAR